MQEATDSSDCPRGGCGLEVSVDGQRFIVTEPVGAVAQQPAIRIVQNWFAEFRDHEQD